MLNTSDQRVEAYLDAIQYKYKTESKAKIVSLGHVIGIYQPQSIVQPWPRSFQYHLEFFSSDQSPAKVQTEIGDYLKENPQEYVLTIFSDQLNTVIPAYKANGYLHAWNNVLMEHKLQSGLSDVQLPIDVEIRDIRTTQDVSAINALDPDYPSSTNGLEDESIINLMVLYRGEVSAKAQALILKPPFAYIADMYTQPRYRRKGLSAALLQKIHYIAQRKGCKQMILMPSKMTREIELYQKYTYQEVNQMALLIPTYSALKPV